MSHEATSKKVFLASSKWIKKKSNLNLNYLPGLMIQSSQSNADVLWLPSAIISSMSIKIGKIILHIIEPLECRLALDRSHNTRKPLECSSREIQ